MTNCIMGFAHGAGYSWNIVKPFVKSLRERARFEGDVVLFTEAKNQMDKDSKAKLKEYNVTEMPIDLSWIPWGTGFMLARFHQQAKTINENSQWERVMLVDTRDMIFQSDLSKFFQDDLLHCAKESIEVWQDVHFNSAGIKASWGEEVYQELAHKTVINSGSIWGGRDSVLNILNNMTNCGAAANCDQHSLIYSVYFRKVPAVLHENDGSWIWTIALTDITGYVFKDGLVYTPDGRVPAIVHQFDRFEELKNKIVGHYQ